MQEVVLAMLAKEPVHGYELRARLRQALGSLGDSMNDGQIYVTLARLERAGLVESRRASDVQERKVYTLTPASKQRLTAWLEDVHWPESTLADFHLKLTAAAAARLADPVALISAQRVELLRRLRHAQRAAMDERDGSVPGLLLEGVVLRLEADLHWLDGCERHWARGREHS